MEVKRLVEYCGKQKVPLLMGCDANAHNVIWGSTDTNNRGEHLLEFLVASNLEILNIGNKPTFVTRARREVLDITVSSQSIAWCIKEWRVSSEESLSDHKIIEFSLGGLDTLIPPFRNPRQTDWKAYRETLAFNLQGISASKRIGNQ